MGNPSIRRNLRPARSGRGDGCYARGPRVGPRASDTFFRDAGVMLG